ncbi:MAG: hypothetical protein R3C19_22305 [Planctomycetaceae bacterium]
MSHNPEIAVGYKPASVARKYFTLALLLAGVVLGARYVLQVAGEIGAAAQSVSRPVNSAGKDPTTTPLSGTDVSELLNPQVQARVDALLAERQRNQDSAAIDIPGETAVPADADSKESRPFPEPIRQDSSLHPQMITPGNFEYVGAFRPPHVQKMMSQFGHGGWGVTYRSDGDQNGPDDGFPGSLYLVGFMRDQLVAEISIPRPRITSSLDEITVAEILQPFGDITAGLQKAITGDSSEPFQIGGMQVVDGRLHWTLFKYYNVAGHDFPHTPCLRWTSMLSTSMARGIWDRSIPVTRSGIPTRTRAISQKFPMHKPGSGSAAET